MENKNKYIENYCNEMLNLKKNILNLSEKEIILTKTMISYWINRIENKTANPERKIVFELASLLTKKLKNKKGNIDIDKILSKIKYDNSDIISINDNNNNNDNNNYSIIKVKSYISDLINTFIKY